MTPGAAGSPGEQPRDLTAALKALTEVLKEGARKAKAVKESAAAPAAAAATGGGLGDSMEATFLVMKGAISQVVSGLRDMVAQLSAIPDRVAAWVKAFNPYVVEQYQRALDNLTATVGAALEPAMQAFLGIARAANDVIGPLFDRLRPIVEESWSVMGERLLPALRLTADAVSALIPAYQLLVTAIQPWLEIVPAVANVLRLLHAVAVGLFDGLLGGQQALKRRSDEMVEAMKNVVRGLIVFAARLAAFLGLGEVVESIRRTFAPIEGGKGKMAAPRDAGISDMASILREAQAAAFAAQGGGAAKATDDWLGDIAGMLDEGLKKQAEWEQTMLAGLRAILVDLGFDDMAANVKTIAGAIEAIRTAAQLTPAAAAVRASRGLNLPAPVRHWLEQFL